jgi:hypothetical protein
MGIFSNPGKSNITRELRYNQPLTVSNDEAAVCIPTLKTKSTLKVTNMSTDQKATFMVVSESECDGTYTLPTSSPGNTWICTTNFDLAKITVTNLSPGAASIQIVLLDMAGEY